MTKENPTNFVITIENVNQILAELGEFPAKQVIKSIDILRSLKAVNILPENLEPKSEQKTQERESKNKAKAS